WDKLTVTITIDDRRIDVGSTASIQASAVYDYDLQPFDGILTLNDTVLMHGDVGRWAYTVLSASADSYGISLIGTNDEDYIIWDRLRILSYWIDEADGRTNVGTIQQVYVTVDYEYDGSVFQGAFGTVFMNSSAMTWNPLLLRWNHSFAYSNPTGYAFQVNGITDLLYGLTAFSEQMSPKTIIWDKLNVVIDADPTVAYYGEVVSFTVTATHQYDNSRVWDLTVETLRNSTPPALIGNFTDTWIGPQDALQQYLVVYAEDVAYGITKFDTLMIQVLWTNAPLVVVDSAFASDGDGRANIGTVVSIYFHCVWLENRSDVKAGQLYVNSTLHSINETGWVSFTDSSSVVIWRYWNVTGVAADGVTDYEMEVPAPQMIWDALRVTIHATDDRINLGEQAVLEVNAFYAYDNSTYEGGLALNNTILRYFTVGIRGYTITSAFGDIAHGITIIQSNQEVGVIWDGLIVDLSVVHHRVDLGTTVSIQTSAIYAYDGSFFDGTLNLNDSVTVQSFVGKRGYTVESAEGGIHGIYVINVYDYAYIIWDELEVYWSQTERDRCGLQDSVQVRFRVRYSFDGTPYTDSNGHLRINGTEASFDSTNGFWFISVSQTTVGSFNYMVNSIDDQSSGVNSLRNERSFLSTAIFDRVYVFLAGVRGRDITTDSDADKLAPEILPALKDSPVTVHFQLRYESDGIYIDDSNTLVIINGERAIFNQTSGRWELVVTGSETGIVAYWIDSFEDQYGLTEVNHGELVPRVEWVLPEIDPELFFLAGGGFGIAAVAAAIVVFIARTKRRVTTLEHALTPEELLSLEDVGISSTMRAQMVNHLEWLRDLTEEIPYMGDDVLMILGEELAQAKEMYVKAFTLEIPTEPAGMRLRDMLLDRIDSILESIEKEMEFRASR
ncbi:MAG: hypothetical protein ACXABV_18330, partial [Candidatus Thorarchaeota archaeon]